MYKISPLETAPRPVPGQTQATVDEIREIVYDDTSSIKSDVENLKPVFVRLLGSTNQTIANTTSTLVTNYESSIGENSANMWVATNPGILTIRVNGTYAVGAEIRWVANTTGYREITLRDVDENGAGLADFGKVIDSPFSGTGQSNMQFNGMTRVMKIGERIGIFVWQNSGGNLDVDVSRLWAYRVA